MAGNASEERLRRQVLREIERRYFCTIATTSAEGRPHVVGVQYAAVDGTVYVASSETSRKVRNIKATGGVAICIPVRRYPVGPPFCVQFQGTARVRALDDPEMVALVDAGQLKKITSHGELDDPVGCFLELTPGRRVATYGLGVSLRTLLRDPVNAARSVAIR